MPDTDPEEKTVKRTQRPVTYRCEWCGQESTELRYPGPPPHYHAACKTPAQNSIARNRMQAWRERNRQQQQLPPPRDYINHNR
jgi:hypothetical protein